MTKSWSFSAWECFSRCRAQYNYKYNLKTKMDVPTPDYFVKGRRVHEVLAEYVSVPSRTIAPDEVKKEIEFIEQLATWPAHKIVEQQWGFTANWSPCNWKTAWYRGICDVAVDYGDWGEVIDWKTGKRWGSNDEQMNCFATMAMHRWPLWEGVTTRLVYVETGGQELADYLRSALPELTAKWNARAAEMFAECDWAPQPGEHCSRCDYAKSKGGPCRFGGV